MQGVGCRIWGTWEGTCGNLQAGLAVSGAIREQAVARRPSGEPRTQHLLMWASRGSAFGVQGLKSPLCPEARPQVIHVWGIGFRFSVFGFRVSGFGVSVQEGSPLRFQVSGFGLRVSGFVLRTSGFTFRVSGFGFRILSVGLPRRPVAQAFEGA